MFERVENRIDEKDITPGANVQINVIKISKIHVVNVNEFEVWINLLC